VVVEDTGTGAPQTQVQVTKKVEAPLLPPSALEPSDDEDAADEASGGENGCGNNTSNNNNQDQSAEPNCHDKEKQSKANHEQAEVARVES
jgi:hypothetical protein